VGVPRVGAREEVEAHQVVARAELAHLAVVGAIVHAAPPAALQQHVALEAQLALALQLPGGQQAVLLQQEHQVLVHGPLDRVPEDHHELVVQQLPHFGRPQVDHGGRGQGARPSACPPSGQVWRELRGRRRTSAGREGEGSGERSGPRSRAQPRFPSVQRDL
jgi:hypothetical protein